MILLAVGLFIFGGMAIMVGQNGGDPWPALMGLLAYLLGGVIGYAEGKERGRSGRR